MYICIGVLLVLCFFFMLINFYRRKSIICRVCCMELCDKLKLLNDLAEPFGFCYCLDMDIITSRVDAFQKNFGYCSLYDKSALKFNMVFDCEPIYFNYGNRTWMIELWKGQYGINVGAEIGVYYADNIVLPRQYKKTIFHGVEETEMLPISMKLHYKGQPFFSFSGRHWWLTGFSMGDYCTPEDLVLELSIVFPNEKMQTCFVESLCRMGYQRCEIDICYNTVSFSYSIPHTRQPRLVYRIRAAISQWKNRVFLRLYHFLTRPFTCTMDKILYLYFYLPIAFRHMLRFKKNRKQKYHKKYRKTKKQQKGS